MYLHCLMHGAHIAGLQLLGYAVDDSPQGRPARHQGVLVLLHHQAHKGLHFYDHNDTLTKCLSHEMLGRMHARGSSRKGWDSMYPQKPWHMLLEVVLGVGAVVVNCFCSSQPPGRVLQSLLQLHTSIQGMRTCNKVLIAT